MTLLMFSEYGFATKYYPNILSIKIIYLALKFRNELMKYIFQTMLMLFILWSTISIAQEQNIAKIGNINISSKEFKQRFEFTPKVKSDFDSTKTNFLYSLVAEKLWALEAESLSMDTIPYVYNSVKNIERKLVKDKLYKIEVESKVIISEKEIAENLFKVDEKRTMNFLFSKNQNEIEDLYNKLYLGASFDSILVSRVEYSEQVKGVPVVFGQMDENVENEIFALRLNQFTKPIHVEIGWVIYNLQSIEFNQGENGLDAKAKRKKVEDILFARRAKIFYSEFFNKYILGTIIHSDKELINQLVDEVYKLLNKNGEKFYNKNNNKYEIDEYQIKIIKNNFTEESLSSNFIKFEISPINLEKYLISLELNGFSCDNLSRDIIYNTVNNNVKSYIFEEILFREGYSRGLQKSVEIQNELKTWRESFLASYFRYSFLDSVETSDSEAKDFYDKVVSENSDVVTETYAEVKEKIKSGLYFKDLENLYIDETVALAKKYGVSVDVELLNSLQVTDIEMMVYRTLGFGGQITAVPYLQSFYTWKNWLPKSVKKSLP